MDSIKIGLTSGKWKITRESDRGFRAQTSRPYHIKHMVELSIHTVVRQHMLTFRSCILSDNHGFAKIDIDVDDRHAKSG